MLSQAKRTSRSVDYLLSVLSPLEVSMATRRYLDSLAPDEFDAVVAHSTARMNDEERAYLAMAPDFATFLDQNHRLLRTLDGDALRAILLPVISSAQGNELVAQLRQALPPPAHRDRWRRVGETASRGSRAVATALLIVGSGVAAALLGAFLVRSLPVPAPSPAPAATSQPVPIAAEARVSGVLTHLVARPAVRPAIHRPVRVAAAAVPRSKTTVAPAPSRAVVTPRPPTPHPATPHPATPRPATPGPATPRPATPRPVTPPPTVAPVRIAAAPISARDPQLVQRARLIVMSYLDSLMRGDASAALGNLGLSASAGTSNLTEAPILAGATEFRIVKAGLNDPKNAKVQVVIDSPQGRYFGDYIVSTNGPAAWITEHEVIPVGNRNR